MGLFILEMKESQQVELEMSHQINFVQKNKRIKFANWQVKTGTPPRLLKSSINWNKVEMQSADS